MGLSEGYVEGKAVELVACVDDCDGLRVDPNPKPNPGSVERVAPHGDALQLGLYTILP